MKKWLRFEDTYGVCDIYCIANRLDFVNGKLEDRESVVIETALSNPGCFNISKARVEAMRRAGAEECLVFFDIDPIGDNEVLTSEWFRKKATRNNFVSYVPVVWCAETMACVCQGIEVDELLHPAEKVISTHGINTKKIRNILIPSISRMNLLGFVGKTKYNSKLLSVLLYGDTGYTFDETVEFLDRISCDLRDC